MEAKQGQENRGMYGTDSEPIITYGFARTDNIVGYKWGDCADPDRGRGR